jgi:hypothetical protein
MDFLFKHVNGNRFKINEGSNDIDRRISKIEEDRALVYIRRVLIPVATRSWNKSCLKSKTCKNCVITAEQISKNLKKVSHAKFVSNDRTTTDTIRYESDFLVGNNQELNGPFRFETYKQVTDGKLLASWENPGSQMPIYYDVGQSVDENSSKLNENHNSEPPISKREEGEALDFIKKKIVPIALRDYNRYSASVGLYFNSITLEDILKNLKKIDIDFPPISSKGIATHSVYDPTIHYGCEFDQQKWSFAISKSLMDGKMYVVWRHPYNFSGKFYLVGGELIREEFDPAQFSKVSKREEQEALRFIKLKLVHKVAPHYKLDPQEIAHGLVKKEKNEDFIAYVYYRHKFDTKPITFFISKSPNNKLIASFYYPNSSTEYRFEVGPGGELREGIERNPDVKIPPELKLSTIEEREALQFIKKIFVEYVLDRWTQVNNFGVTTDALIYSINKTLHKVDVGMDYKDSIKIIDGEAVTVNIPYEYVTYKADKPTFISFTIFKQYNGELMVRSQIEKIGTIAVNIRGRLFEGSIKIKNRPPQIERLISKIEEDQILQYIRRIIIPWAIKEYNYGNPEDINQLKSSEDISRNLRKISIKYDPKEKEEIIEYRAPHPVIDDDEFVFRITKIKDREIGVKYYNPSKALFWFPKKLWSSSRKLPDPHSKSLSESKQEELTLSKREEDQLYQVLLRKIIPDSVEIFNLTQHIHSGMRDIGIKEVISSIRKTERSQLIVKYKAIIEDYSFHYFIRKTYNERYSKDGSLEVHLRLGFFVGRDDEPPSGFSEYQQFIYIDGRIEDFEPFSTSEIPY